MTAEGAVLRLFIALEPPPPVRERLAGIQAELKRAAGLHAADVRWVQPDNLHLTLQFLGAVPEAQLQAIGDAVRAAAAASPALRLEVRGAGAFPHARRPRVLWAGLAGDLAPLSALAAAVGTRLTPLGFPPESRPFSAHVTLGRSREARGAPALAGALQVTADSAGPAWNATEVAVVQSHLGRSGSRYETLIAAPLSIDIA